MNGGRAKGCTYDFIPNTTERGGGPDTGGWSVSRYVVFMLS